MRKPRSHRAHRPLQGCLRAVSIVGFGVLAACGRGNDGADTASSNAQSDTAPTSLDRSIILATTTSTQDSGLLDSLLPRFRAATGIEVKVIAVGTGAALDMARRGNADAVLAHAPGE